MTPFRFVHMADVHLDTCFYSRDPFIRSKLREAIRASFQKAIDICIQKKVHCLLIAGDLFDGERFSFETEKFLFGEFDRLKNAGIKVFYCTGNHDPANSGNRFGNFLCPPNVCIFKDNQPVTFNIPDENGEIVGKVTSCGYRTSRETANLAETFPRADTAVPHVAMLHTMVHEANGSERHDPYAPCSIHDLSGKGYDYWALGHIHLRQQIGQNSNIYYSGNIQGRSPKETGPRGCLYVEIQPKLPAAVEFVDLSSIQWFDVNAAGLQEVNSFQYLKAVLLEKVEKVLSGQSASEAIIRLELDGTCPLYSEINEEGNRRVLEEDLVVGIQLKTGVEVLQIEVLTGNLKPPFLLTQDVNFGFTGKINEIIARLEEENVQSEALIEELMPERLAGINHATNEEQKQYVRKLLEGLKEECISRMIGE